MNRRHFLYGAIGIAVLQSGAVGAMIANRASKIANGKEVLLKSRLVDPRDLFRGHYVTLNLDVGELDPEKINVDREFKYNDPVYVSLEKGEDLFWQANGMYAEKPKGIDSPIIKGKIRSAASANLKTYRVTFPFDRFFAPKERALELENARRDQKLGVALSLDDEGVGYIKGIVVDGKVIYDEPLF